MTTTSQYVQFIKSILQPYRQQERWGLGAEGGGEKARTTTRGEEFDIYQYK